MPVNKYALEILEPKKFALATARDVDISKKHAVEIFSYIRGKQAVKAEQRLEEGISMDRAIPFKRFNRWMPHRKGAGYKTGKYPEKASRFILEVLRNAMANAEFKGLSKDKLKIVHASANRSIILPRVKPTGRWKRSDIELVHLEIALREC